MAENPVIKSEIRSLTGLRGAAAVFVVFYHALHAGPALAGLLLGRGYLCVDLFFVLSGYVMALNYKTLFADGGSFPNYLKFLGLRLARIYPLYLAILLLTTVLVSIGAMPLYDVPNLMTAFWWNLSLMQGWSFGAGNINLAAWSISTEWSAYLLFPILVAAVFSASQARAWLMGALAIVVLIAIAIVAPRIFPTGEFEGPLAIFGTQDPLAVFRCVAGFLLGLVVYRLQDTQFGDWLGARPITGDLLAALLVVFILVPSTDIVFVVGCALLIMHLVRSTSAASTLLGSGVVYYLGTISYSLYLVHVPVLLTLRRFFDTQGWPWTAASLLGIVISLACAPIAYHFIEVPGRKAMRALLSPRRPART
jgi:peptidoglycan/LPS O-acetylase OafA/YrhL